MKPADWLARFETGAARMGADLEALVSHESPSDDAERVSLLAEWVRDRLLERGVAAETRTCAGSGDAVVARIGGGTGGTLLLGHLDTVWPVGSLRDLPFRVEDGRATGPGVFDMKAGIAVAMAALESLAGEGGRTAATLLLVPDEEIGTGASRGLILDLARGHRCALVLEPSLDGAAKVARKAAALIDVRFRGRAAHAGLEPEKGASALAELARFVLFLEPLADPARETTVLPTVARSGSRANVVPEEASLTVDARAWSRDEARRLERAIRGYRPADPRVSVEVAVGYDRPPLEPTAESRELFERARAFALEMGLVLDAARAGGSSDGVFTAAAGVPTLDGLGPRGGGAHAKDEFVLLSDLPARAALIAVLADDSK